MYFLLSVLLAPGSLLCLALTLEAHKGLFSIYKDLNLTSPSWSFLSTLQQNTATSPFSFNTNFILFSSPRLAETLHLISYHRIKDFTSTKGLLLPQTRERACCCACSLAHTAPLLALPLPRLQNMTLKESLLSGCRLKCGILSCFTQIRARSSTLPLFFLPMSHSWGWSTIVNELD